MSVYESIAKSALKVKRRLFDHNVATLGQTMKVVRIKGVEDIYHDLGSVEVIDSDLLTVVVKFPDNVPLERYRSSNGLGTNDTRMFFFDLLPIEIYGKIDDKLEVHDILFFYLGDEDDNRLPMLLQITETFGQFDMGLVWKKANAAPQNGALTQDILSELAEFYGSGEEDAYVREEPAYTGQAVVRESRVDEVMR